MREALTRLQRKLSISHSLFDYVLSDVERRHCMSTQKAATENLQPLEPFVGIWETEGKMRASGSGQPEKFSANDTYEWVSGGSLFASPF